MWSTSWARCASTTATVRSAGSVFAGSPRTWQDRRGGHGMHRSEPPRAGPGQLQLGARRREQARGGHAGAHPLLRRRGPGAHRPASSTTWCARARSAPSSWAATTTTPRAPIRPTARRPTSTTAPPLTSDMAHHCFAGNIARGMTYVVLSNGGGVGTGKCFNGGYGHTAGRLRAGGRSRAVGPSTGTSWAASPAAPGRATSPPWRPPAWNGKMEGAGTHHRARRRRGDVGRQNRRRASNQGLISPRRHGGTR